MKLLEWMGDHPVLAFVLAFIMVNGVVAILRGP
jgi:hypothetical protein